MSEPSPLVMIVDDDAALLRLLAEGLQAAGLTVSTAVSADQALATLRSGDGLPDVILSDIIMPGTDGLSFCRAIRADDRLQHLPILLLSCRRQVQDRVAGLEAGADDYLIKPFHMSELVARIRAAHRRGIRSASPVEAAPIPDPPSAPPMSRPGSFSEGEQAFKAGEFHRAYEIWSNLLEEEPSSVELKRWKGIARQNLMRKYDRMFGGMDSILSSAPVDPTVLRQFELGAKEGFILSRLDGQNSVRVLCSTSGLSRMATLDILARLLEAGIIRIIRKEPPKRGER